MSQHNIRLNIEAVAGKSNLTKLQKDLEGALNIGKSVSQDAVKAGQAYARQFLRAAKTGTTTGGQRQTMSLGLGSILSPLGSSAVHSKELNRATQNLLGQSVKQVVKSYERVLAQTGSVSRVSQIAAINALKQVGVVTQRMWVNTVRNITKVSSSIEHEYKQRVEQQAKDARIKRGEPARKNKYGSAEARMFVTAQPEIPGYKIPTWTPEHGRYPGPVSRLKGRRTLDYSEKRADKEFRKSLGPAYEQTMARRRAAREEARVLFGHAEQSDRSPTIDAILASKQRSFDVEREAAIFSAQTTQSQIRQAVGMGILGTKIPVQTEGMKKYKARVAQIEATSRYAGNYSRLINGQRRLKEIDRLARKTKIQSVMPMTGTVINTTLASALATQAGLTPKPAWLTERYTKSGMLFPHEEIAQENERKKQEAAMLNWKRFDPSKISNPTPSLLSRMMPQLPFMRGMSLFGGMGASMSNWASKLPTNYNLKVFDPRINANVPVTETEFLRYHEHRLSQPTSDAQDEGAFMKISTPKGPLEIHEATGLTKRDLLMSMLRRAQGRDDYIRTTPTGEEIDWEKLQPKQDTFGEGTVAGPIERERKAAAYYRGAARRDAKAKSEAGITKEDSSEVYALNVMHRAAVWMSILSVYARIKQEIVMATKELFTLESGVARISILFKESGKTKGMFASEVISGAKEYSRTISESMEIYKEYARQGRTNAEVATLFSSSLLAMNAVDISAAHSVQYLTTVQKAWNASVGESVTMIDELFQMESRHAATAKDITEMIKRSAAAANALGVNRQQLMAMGTALIAQTQRPGETIGTSLKTIMPRLYRPASANAAQQLLGGGGIYKAPGELKDTYQILSEIAEKWTELSQEQKISFSLKIIDARRMQDFLALMEGWDEVKRAFRESEDAAGSAYEAHLAAVDTTTAKLQQARSNLVGMVHNLGITKATNVAAGTLATATALPSNLAEGISGGSSMAKGILNFGFMGTIVGMLSPFLIQFMYTLFNRPSEGYVLKSLIPRTPEYMQQSSRLTQSMNGFFTILLDVLRTAPLINQTRFGIPLQYNVPLPSEVLPVPTISPEPGRILAPNGQPAIIPPIGTGVATDEWGSAAGAMVQPKRVAFNYQYNRAMIAAEKATAKQAAISSAASKGMVGATMFKSPYAAILLSTLKIAGLISATVAITYGFVKLAGFLQKALFPTMEQLNQEFQKSFVVVSKSLAARRTFEESQREYTEARKKSNEFTTGATGDLAQKRLVSATTKGIEEAQKISKSAAKEGTPYQGYMFKYSFLTGQSVKQITPDIYNRLVSMAKPEEVKLGDIKSNYNQIQKQIKLAIQSGDINNIGKAHQNALQTFEYLERNRGNFNFGEMGSSGFEKMMSKLVVPAMIATGKGYDINDANDRKKFIESFHTAASETTKSIITDFDEIAMLAKRIRQDASYAYRAVQIQIEYNKERNKLLDKENSLFGYSRARNVTSNILQNQDIQGLQKSITWGSGVPNYAAASKIANFLKGDAMNDLMRFYGHAVDTISMFGDSFASGSKGELEQKVKANSSVMKSMVPQTLAQFVDIMSGIQDMPLTTQKALEEYSSAVLQLSLERTPETIGKFQKASGELYDAAQRAPETFGSFMELMSVIGNGLNQMSDISEKSLVEGFDAKSQETTEMFKKNIEDLKKTREEFQTAVQRSIKTYLDSIQGILSAYQEKIETAISQSQDALKNPMVNYSDVFWSRDMSSYNAVSGMSQYLYARNMNKPVPFNSPMVQTGLENIFAELTPGVKEGAQTWKDFLKNRVQSIRTAPFMTKEGAVSQGLATFEGIKKSISDLSVYMDAPLVAAIQPAIKRIQELSEAYTKYTEQMKTKTDDLFIGAKEKRRQDIIDSIIMSSSPDSIPYLIDRYGQPSERTKREYMEKYGLDKPNDKESKQMFKLQEEALNIMKDKIYTPMLETWFGKMSEAYDRATRNMEEVWKKPDNPLIQLMEVMKDNTKVYRDEVTPALEELSTWIQKWVKTKETDSKEPKATFSPGWTSGSGNTYIPSTVLN